MKAGCRRILAVATLAVLAGVWVHAGVYKEGKPVSGVKSEIDILTMKWGKLDETNDRIIGTVRVINPRVVLQPYNYTFALTFDFFDKAGQRLDSLDTTFSFKTYGYQTKETYIEGEFCVDLATNAERRRVTLTNVKINSEAAKYQTKFNISASLMRTGFALPEPKLVPVR